MIYPLISVLMPAYNAGQYIKEALDSIIATQYPNLEIIVINDGSTDKTAEIVESYPFPIRLYHQENKGIPVTRNRTLDLMTGDIFTFLDADDSWTPYKFDVQCPLLVDDIEVVLGQSRYYSEQIPWTSLLLSTGLFRRSVFEKVGYFDENLPIGEDTDWTYRLLEANLRVVLHKNIVHHYRRHPTNTTVDEVATSKVSMLMVKMSLDRRRAANNWTNKKLIDSTVDTPSDAEFMKRYT